MRRALTLCLVAALVAIVVTQTAGSAPAVVTRIAIPGSIQPCAAAVGGRFVWISAYAAPYLLKVDPRKNVVVGRTKIGYGSCGLGLGAGSLWIEDTNSNTVSRVSVRTGKRIAAIPVGATPYDATFAFGAAWATSNGNGEVDRIDPTRNKVVKRFKLSTATGVVGAFGSVWATGLDGVVRIDPAANSIVATIPVNSAAWTAASSDGVWVTTPTGVSRIDPATNTLVASIQIAGPLGDPAVIGGRLWVPQISKNKIVIIDPATNTITQRLTAGKGPFVVTEINGEAWVPSWQGTDTWRYRP